MCIFTVWCHPKTNAMWYLGIVKWLGIVKSKSGFRSTPNPSIYIANSYLTEFSSWPTDWLTSLLTNLFLQTSIITSIMAKTTGLISSLHAHAHSMLHPEMYLFVNRSCSNACITVLPKLTFVLLCVQALFLSPLLYRWRFVVGFSVRLGECNTREGASFAISLFEVTLLFYRSIIGCTF